MWEVNVLGLMQMTRALLPALELSGRGHIVNISSTAGFEVYEGGSGYTSAKHAVHAITQTLRLELVCLLYTSAGTSPADCLSQTRARLSANWPGLRSNRLGTEIRP